MFMFNLSGKGQNISWPRGNGGQEMDLLLFVEKWVFLHKYSRAVLGLLMYLMHFITIPQKGGMIPLQPGEKAQLQRNRVVEKQAEPQRSPLTKEPCLPPEPDTLKSHFMITLNAAH